MLSRLVRTQLIMFTIASVIGVAVMSVNYLQVPTWLGIGRISITVELPATGGLYRFGNVTYRGVQIGNVSAVTPTAQGATAVLSLHDDPKIPASVRANVRSVSAVGEQYVDLIPTGDGPPFLSDGSIIAADDTSVPVRVGPMLDQLGALVKTVPKEQLSHLLDESYQAFNGAGYDIASLLDSASRISVDANATAPNTRRLIEDSRPLLDSQVQTTDALRTLTRSLAAVTDQVVHDDPALRTLLATGPDAEIEVSRLLDEIKPTLPVLLANLTSVAEVGVTYNPSLRQLLVLLPPYVAGFGSLSQLNNSTGLSYGGFALMNGDPPPCTVGFLPPNQWRSPDDESTIDTPDGLYCKLPQDSPIAVRGVRNNACMGQPGKRAPTVEICNSDRPYMPLAMRQHVLGPYPFDPNLVAAGVPLDSRALPDTNTFGPLEGTPMPDPAEAAPGPEVVMPSASLQPNSFADHGTDEATAAEVPYDPRTGRYVGGDGKVYQQSNLSDGGDPAGWKDLLPH